MTDPVQVAHAALEQARAYRPSSDLERRRQAENIRTIEKWLQGRAAARLAHPAGSDRKGTR